jgi:hypothetical protein
VHSNLVDPQEVKHSLGQVSVAKLHVDRLLKKKLFLVSGRVVLEINRIVI